MSTYIAKNAFLSDSEMAVNAEYIYRYLGSRGWTLNAVAGMLGNMETESTINPAIWQNLDEGNTSLGYGLVQWTPATKILGYCDAIGASYTSMDAQLQRIIYERDNGLQYYQTDAYPLSFTAFSTSKESPEYLANAFLLNYERPADQSQPNRATQARKWYNALSGVDVGGGGEVTPPTPDAPDEPETPPLVPHNPKRKGMSLFMKYIATRM